MKYTFIFFEHILYLLLVVDKIEHATIVMRRLTTRKIFRTLFSLRSVKFVNIPQFGWITDEF
jgi:hypothetical protein